MTCDEFRRITSSNDSPLTVTERGVRAALALHWAKCLECKSWLETIDTPAKDAEEAASLEALSIQDAKDPEVREMLRKPCE